jgi:hypothetical protein
MRLVPSFAPYAATRGALAQTVNRLNNQLRMRSRVAEGSSAGSTSQPPAGKGDRFAGAATEGDVETE